MVDRLKLVKAPQPSEPHTVIISTEPRYMDRIIRVAIGIELHPSNTKREDGFCLSKSWKPLIFFLKPVGSLHHMTADLGSPRGHAGPCTLPVSRHKICPLPSLSSPPPWCPSFLPLPLLSQPKPHSWDSRTSRRFPVQHTFTLFPLSLYNTSKISHFQCRQKSCTCLVLVRSVVVWQLRDFILPHGRANGNWGPLFHFPPVSNIIRNFLTTNLFGLPSAFELVFSSAYSTLKMETTCFSETFNGLYGVRSQKIVFFITTTLRISNPIW
jgi:hypothetical protein